MPIKLTYTYLASNSLIISKLGKKYLEAKILLEIKYYMGNDKNLEDDVKTNSISTNKFLIKLNTASLKLKKVFFQFMK
jgi:hypothetical protein